MSIAHTMFTSPALRNITYNGTVSNATGMSNPIMMTTRITLRPGKANFAMA